MKNGYKIHLNICVRAELLDCLQCLVSPVHVTNVCEQPPLNLCDGGIEAGVGRKITAKIQTRLCKKQTPSGRMPGLMKHVKFMFFSIKGHLSTL